MNQSKNKPEQKKDPMQAILDQLESYDKGAPKRKSIFGTWGE